MVCQSPDLSRKILNILRHSGEGVVVLVNPRKKLIQWCLIFIREFGTQLLFILRVIEHLYHRAEHEPQEPFDSEVKVLQVPVEDHPELFLVVLVFRVAVEVFIRPLVEEVKHLRDLFVGMLCTGEQIRLEVYPVDCRNHCSTLKRHL